jgi:hypothetical protein
MSLVEMNEVKRGEVWFLDSGCSNHMSGDAEKFCEVNRGFKQQVKLGNNTRISVEGKGKIKLKLNGMNHIITDVFYMPELHNNLLSVGQMQEKGLAFLFHAGMCKIYHPKRGMIIQTSMSANKCSYCWQTHKREMMPAFTQAHHHQMSPNCGTAGMAI